MAGTRYVYLVHGTWGYKDDPQEPPPWYAPESQFASRLRQHLADEPDGVGRWEVRSFVWKECGNDHANRIVAAQALADEIDRLRRDDPDARVSFVAHSHGGNVVLEALALHITRLQRASAEQYKSVLNELEQRRRRAKSSEELYQTPPTPEELRPLLESRFPSEQASALAEIPRGHPQAFGWRSFLRTLDISEMDLHWRTIRTIARWSAIAADTLTVLPTVHGIDRLVFLGTPFMHKHWNVNHHRAWRAMERAWRVVRVTAAALLFVYAVCVIAALYTAGRQAWNPAAWPWWVLAIGAFFAVSQLPTVPEAFRARRFVDTNVYFDVGSPLLRRFAAALPQRDRFPCLVVSADLLDEAILALSARPVVDGVFRPQLRRWLRLDDEEDDSRAEGGGRRMLQRGIDWDIETGAVLEVILTLVRRVLSVVLFPIFFLGSRVWRWTLGPLVAWQTRSIVRNVADVVALGLPPGELRGARVVADTRIDVPKVFDEKPVWDVTEASLRMPPLQQIGRELERFAFLLPRHGLPNPDPARHFLYAPLSREFGVGAPSLERHRMLQAALVIDERVKEASGAIALVHSSYYGNIAVIDTVAAFLRSGVRPLAV